MRRFNFFITLAFILCLSSAFLQSQSVANASSKCQFAEVFRQDGWTIPSIDNAKPRPRTTLAKHPGMYLTKLDPLDADYTLTIATCKSTAEGRLEIKEITARIVRLWAFDAGSKPFAYRLEYIESGRADDKRAESNAPSTVFFYDLDGTGLFSLFKIAESSDATLPSYIPDWAQNEMDQPTIH